MHTKLDSKLELVAPGDAGSLCRAANTDLVGTGPSNTDPSGADQPGALVLAVVHAAPAAPWRVADLLERVPSASAILSTGSSFAYMAHLSGWRADLAAFLSSSESRSAIRATLGYWRSMIHRAHTSNGSRLVTVLDATYPANLRAVPRHPPYLFVRGGLSEDDQRSVAIVGARRPSSTGLSLAADIANGLVQFGVTVTSGLARGIDAAAHTAAVNAAGRTIAVLGSGTSSVYPRQNVALADMISATGAVISQFLPDVHASRHSFPLRNAVTSGLSLGTCVIEARENGGAFQQAMLALAQSRILLLPRVLLDNEPWARSLARRFSQVRVIHDAEDIIDAIGAAVPHDSFDVGRLF